MTEYKDLYLILKSIPLDKDKYDAYLKLENTVTKTSELMLMLSTIIIKDEYKLQLVCKLIIEGVKIDPDDLLEICSRFASEENRLIIILACTLTRKPEFHMNYGASLVKIITRKNFFLIASKELGLDSMISLAWAKNLK